MSLRVSTKFRTSASEKQARLRARPKHDFDTLAVRPGKRRRSYYLAAGLTDSGTSARK